MKRIISFDVMRTIAVFAVVFEHIAGQNFFFSFPSFEWEVRNIYISLGRGFFSLFLMISGALFLSPEKPLVIKKLYSKNIFRIIYVFLFWSIIYVVYIEGLNSGPKVAFLSVLKGPPHFWFLKMMIGLYVMIPLLRVVAANREALHYLVAFLGVTTFVIPAVFDYIELLNGQRQFFLEDFYIAFGLQSLVYVGYFVLGHYLYVYSLGKRTKYLIYIFGVLGLIGSAIATSVYSHQIGETSGFFFDDFHFLVLFETLAAFLFIKDHCTGGSPTFQRVIISLSTCSFGVYLIHPLIMYTFDEYFGLNSTSFNPLFFIPVFDIIIFSLSFALVKLIFYIPFMNKMVR